MASSQPYIFLCYHVLFFKPHTKIYEKKKLNMNKRFIMFIIPLSNFSNKKDSIKYQGVKFWKENKRITLTFLSGFLDCISRLVHILNILKNFVQPYLKKL